MATAPACAVTRPATTLRLADLVAPLSPEDFIERHWLAGRPFLSRPDPTLVSRVRLAPVFKDPATLFRAMQESVMLFGPNQMRASVPATQAEAFLHAGFTVYCTHVDRWVSGLGELTRELTVELGVPTGMLAVEAFVGRKGAVSSFHYDHDINFQILLEGSKSWALAPNRHIRNPISAYHPVRLGERTLSAFLDEVIADDPALPARAIEPSHRWQAAGGSVLFLPRGYWHETRVESEVCFAINLVLRGTDWATALTTALRRRLQGIPAARAYLLGALSPYPALAAHSREAARAIREGALRELGELTDEEIFLAPLSGRFAWTAKAEPRALVEREGTMALVVGEAGGAAPLEVDAALVPVLRRLVALKNGCSWEHALLAARTDLATVGASGVWNLLLELTELGLLAWSAT